MSIRGILKGSRRQSGMVSIFTATLLILVVSLVVLALAQISRREQRSSLDNQLSTQAFYAAESGINDAISAIRTQLASGGLVATKDSCADSSPYDFSSKSVLSAANNVKYSCVLIDPTPSTVEATLGQSPSVLALTPENPSMLNQFKLSWKPSTSGNYTSCPSGVDGRTDFKPTTGWQCSFGVVRVDLVPVGTLDRGTLMSKTVTAFFVPTGGAATDTNYGDLASTGAGRVIAAHCTAANCQANLNSVPPGKYYMRATAIYRKGFNLTVDSNDTAGKFVGSQVSIDSTGKAQDVLRRLVVRVSLVGNQPSLATAALMSGDSICKKFSVYGGYFATPDSIAGGGGNPMCEVKAGTPPVVACKNPHDIVMVLDESDSMHNTWQKGTRQSELQTVMNGYIVPTADTDGNHIALVSFSTKNRTQMRVPLSDNQATLRNGVLGLDLISGTYYSEGLKIAGDILFNRNGHTGARDASVVPKVVIFVSDGNPNSGETDSQILALTTALKNQKVTIYVVGIQFSDTDLGLLNQMATDGSASHNTTRYYTNAALETDFESFFSGVKSDISCPTP